MKELISWEAAKDKIELPCTKSKSKHEIIFIFLIELAVRIQSMKLKW